MAADGSVILVGITSGNWSMENVGNVDFAAAKVDPDAEEVWRWQARHRGRPSLSLRAPLFSSEPPYSIVRPLSPLIRQRLS